MKEIKGELEFNGEKVEVIAYIEEGYLCILFPSEHDTTNWYHAICLKHKEG